MKLAQATLLLIPAFLMACASVPRPERLVQLDSMMQDPAQIEAAQKAAPELFERSQTYYAKASQAYEDEEMEKTEHYTEVAELTFLACLEQAKIDRLNAEIQNSEERLSTAERIKSEQDERHARYEKRVARMTRIVDLESSKAEREKMMAEERREADVKSFLIRVAGNIDTAEALEAEKVDADGMVKAKDHLAKAETALAAKNFDLARQTAAKADTLALAAAGKARKKMAAQSAELGQLSERQALFEQALTVGANAVKRENRGVVITLHDLFASGKNEVLPDRAGVLKKIAELAAKYKSYPVVVEGYTDSRGASAANLALSTGRAQSVVDFLVTEAKMDFQQVKSAGYGEDRPIGDNSSSEGRAKNRRIEVVFLFR